MEALALDRAPLISGPADIFILFEESIYIYTCCNVKAWRLGIQDKSRIGIIVDHIKDYTVMNGVYPFPCTIKCYDLLNK